MFNTDQLTTSGAEYVPVAAHSPVAGEIPPGRIPPWKRILDVAGVLLALPILIPVGIALAAIIKIVSPGPAFFRQQRVGYLGKRFMCVKFRTMKVNSDTTVHQNHLKELMTVNGPTRKLDCKGDPRLILGGFLMRSLGADELPQVINVLRGEMSLVGPRPCTPYEYDLLSLAPQAAVRGAARFDRFVADQRQEPDDIRGDDQSGPALCEAQIALAGPEDNRH